MLVRAPHNLLPGYNAGEAAMPIDEQEMFLVYFEQPDSKPVQRLPSSFCVSQCAEPAECLLSVFFSSRNVASSFKLCAYHSKKS